MWNIGMNIVYQFKKEKPKEIQLWQWPDAWRE